MADWRARAACIGMDPELFFPPDRGLPRAAAEACSRCEVRTQCLDQAAQSDDWLWGVRGGLSEAERAAMPRPGADPVRRRVSVSA